MRKWLLLIAIPFVVIACGGSAPAKTESAPAAAPKAAAAAPAAAPAAAAQGGALVGGPFPANEVKNFRIVPSINEDCCFNGIGWEKGSNKGSSLLFKGDEMAIESPNSFGDSIRTLTFKVLGFDAANNVIDTVVGSTSAFGTGALNNFWNSVPYAKVAIKMSADGRQLQFRFGDPADSIAGAVAPALAADNPVLNLR